MVSDIPFGVASRDKDFLLKSCIKLIQKSGAEAVKIEGGKRFEEKVNMLTEAGIPVMGHIGLLPQQVLQLGGYRKFGKTQEEAESLLEDAKALERAGVFSIVMEMVEPAVAEAVGKAVNVPIIGIGAGKSVDGQILVITDVLGLNTGEIPSIC